MSNEEEFEVVRSSGNVFRDLGDPDAELLQMKAVLASEIIRALDARHLTPSAAATLTGTAAADLRNVRRAKLRNVTLDKLVAILGKLDREIELSFTVRPRASALPMMPAE